MRRLGVCAGVVLAAAVIGCGEGKKLPDEVVKPQPTHVVPPDPLGPVPTASDADAKAVLDRAVKAITQGDPARLAKARVNKVDYRGWVLLPTTDGTLTMTDATLSWEVVWPDRVLATYKFQGTPPATNAFRLRESLGWMTKGTELEPANPTEMGHVVSAALVGQHGVPLGLSLADSRGLAFEMRKAEPGGLAATSVKLALPDMPILQIGFDASGLPVALEYYPLEFNKRVRKVLTFAEHKPQGDFVLPTKLELNQNGRLAEKWTLEKAEFPEKIDDSRFDAPK